MVVRSAEARGAMARGAGHPVVFISSPASPQGDTVPAKPEITLTGVALSTRALQSPEACLYWVGCTQPRTQWGIVWVLGER